MKLGTIVYENEIYNLDYMSDEELKDVINKIENNKKKNIYEMKNVKHD